MGIGPLMLDIAGTLLEPEDKELISHPMVGGVILFSRNYESPQQIQTLIGDMRKLRGELIIAVDQEGGRVQRFKTGVTRLPPLRQLGEHFRQDAPTAIARARDWGWLMAAEMTSLGVDISFAPVLDIDYGRSDVIGDRAFSDSPVVITELAKAYIEGMQMAGMAATGKHFPGHGWVVADSHTEIPVDDRSIEEITSQDLLPFIELAQHLSGIMPAHVIYSQIDQQPAGFSRYWIQQQLRQALGFNGVVFSDDLTMEGATVVGGFPQRAEAALQAGCDMVLVCNHRQGACDVLDWLEQAKLPVQSEHLGQLQAKPQVNWQQLQSTAEWQRLHQALTQTDKQEK